MLKGVKGKKVSVWSGGVGCLELVYKKNPEAGLSIQLQEIYKLLKTNLSHKTGLIFRLTLNLICRRTAIGLQVERNKKSGSSKLITLLAVAPLHPLAADGRTGFIGAVGKQHGR